jgi:hypothetical protein
MESRTGFGTKGACRKKARKKKKGAVVSGGWEDRKRTLTDIRKDLCGVRKLISVTSTKIVLSFHSCFFDRIVLFRECIIADGTQSLRNCSVSILSGESIEVVRTLFTKEMTTTTTMMLQTRR